MADDERLVPLFVPALAVILGAKEKDIGRSLKEEEVVALRDGAACITVPAPEVIAVSESRGFVDVDPENCWADWHRLQVQLTGRGFLPKLVLCVLGGDDFRERVEARLTQEQIEHEFSERDERMLEAFQILRSGAAPSFSEYDFQQIAGHTTALYLMSDNFTAREAPAACRKFLRIGCWLLENGGTAMKCESSGIAHSRERWLQLAHEAERGELTTPETWNALFRTLVQFPIADSSEQYSCGMHLLGRPDVIIASALLPANLAGLSQAGTAAFLMHSFCWYLLAQCRDKSFVSGHTFQPEARWPIYRLVWEKCQGYDEDDLYFNPFGRWRFTPAV